MFLHAPKLLRVFDCESEARLLAACGVGLDNSALLRLVDRLVCHWEEFLCSSDILSGERLRKRLGRAVESALTAQIKNVLPLRGAYRLLCRAGNCHVRLMYCMRDKRARVIGYQHDPADSREGNRGWGGTSCC